MRVCWNGTNIGDSVSGSATCATKRAFLGERVRHRRKNLSSAETGVKNEKMKTVECRTMHKKRDSENDSAQQKRSPEKEGEKKTRMGKKNVEPG